MIVIVIITHGKWIDSQVQFFHIFKKYPCIYKGFQFFMIAIMLFKYMIEILILLDDESDNENKHQDNDRDDGRGRKRVFEKLGENTTDVNSKTILIEKMPEEKADNLALIKRRVHFEVFFVS